MTEDVRCPYEFHVAPQIPLNMRMLTLNRQAWHSLCDLLEKLTSCFPLTVSAHWYNCPGGENQLTTLHFRKGLRAKDSMETRRWWAIVYSSAKTAQALRDEREGLSDWLPCPDIVRFFSTSFGIFWLNSSMPKLCKRCGRGNAHFQEDLSWNFVQRLVLLFRSVPWGQLQIALRVRVFYHLQRGSLVVNPAIEFGACPEPFCLRLSTRTLAEIIKAPVSESWLLSPVRSITLQ